MTLWASSTELVRQRTVLIMICCRFSLDNLSTTGLLVVIAGIYFTNPHSGLLSCKCTTGFEKCLWWKEEPSGSQLISLQLVSADCTVHGASRQGPHPSLGDVGRPVSSLWGDNGVTAPQVRNTQVKAQIKKKLMLILVTAKEKCTVLVLLGLDPRP